MMKVRQMLTEILIGVTNEEITSVAHEVYSREKARAAKGTNIYKTTCHACANMYKTIHRYTQRHCTMGSLAVIKRGQSIVTFLKNFKKNCSCLILNKILFPMESDLNFLIL
jgi:hypothetical protein